MSTMQTLRWTDTRAHPNVVVFDELGVFGHLTSPALGKHTVSSVMSGASIPDLTDRNKIHQYFDSVEHLPGPAITAVVCCIGHLGTRTGPTIDRFDSSMKHKVGRLANLALVASMRIHDPQHVITLTSGPWREDASISESTADAALEAFVLALARELKKIKDGPRVNAVRLPSDTTPYSSSTKAKLVDLYATALRHPDSGKTLDPKTGALFK